MTGDLGGLLRIAALAVAALLPLINPAGGAPIFLSMTPGASDATRADLARRIGLDAFLLLASAALFGSYVLSFFGLSLAVVKIAGGLLVISSGWRMTSVDATAEPAPHTTEPAWGAMQVATRAFYPLTL